MVGGGEVEKVGADAGGRELARRIEIGGNTAQIDHVMVIDADQHSLTPRTDTRQTTRALGPQRLHPDTDLATGERQGHRRLQREGDQMTAAEIHPRGEGLKQLPRQGDIVSGGPPQIRVIQRRT